jgi:hypothetical protein
MHVTVSDYDLLAGFYDNVDEPSSFREFRYFITRAAIGKRRCLFYFSIILLLLFESIDADTGATFRPGKFTKL